MTSGSDWIGTVGDTWAAEWRRTDRSFTDLSPHLDAAILAAAPEGAFRALDIGCGAGGTSLALARARSDAVIVGVDLSAGLIDVARKRIATRSIREGNPAGGAASDAIDAPGRPVARKYGVGHDAVTFLVGDATTAAPALAPFDLLYSRHGVMFFDDPVAAFTTLRAAANPGARLVFSCFAEWSDNSFAKALADATGSPPPVRNAPGPFAFQDGQRVADILADTGWRDTGALLTPFAYRAGAGVGDAAVQDALSFFQRIGPAALALRSAAPDERSRLIDRITGVICDHRVGEAIDFPASAWIWSAKA